MDLLDVLNQKENTQTKKAKKEEKAYKTLYLQLRPKTFNEIIGQDVITKILKNQVRTNKIANAYLFSGHKGCGKTSTARLFAKAINCKNPKDGEPCNECESCKAINSGNGVDIIELDAASNNGVDNARDLIEKAAFLPYNSKKKVYIIDEAHMLTTQAFNALLKTLEEPPEHTMFILCTTEPKKLPSTILSRCQRYDFKRIPYNTLKKKISDTLNLMNITYDLKTLDLLVRLSDGSLRDALALAEQVSNLGNELKYEEVTELMGVAAEDTIYEIVDAIITKNYIKAIQTVDEIITSGKDILYYSMDILQYFRNMLVVKNTKNEMELKLINCPDWIVEKINKSINNVTNEEITKFIDVFYDVEKDIKSFVQPKKALEVAIIKCIEIKNSKDNTKEIMKKIEDIVLSLDTIKAQMKLEKIKEEKIINNVKKEDKTEDNKKENITKESIQNNNVQQNYKEKWDGFLEYLKSNKYIILSTLLKLSKLKSINGKIVIGFDSKNKFAIPKLQEEKILINYMKH